MNEDAGLFVNCLQLSHSQGRTESSQSIARPVLGSPNRLPSKLCFGLVVAFPSTDDVWLYILINSNQKLFLPY